MKWEFEFWVYEDIPIKKSNQKVQSYDFLFFLEGGGKESLSLH